MRNIRAKRRFRFVLVGLLIICVILFIEDRIEAFVPEMKSFAELRIEDAMSGRIKLSIGGVDGGILHPLTFNDVKIENGKGVIVLPSLAISSIKTSYRVWDIFSAALAVNGKNKQGVFPWLLSGVSRLDVNFITADKGLSGFVRFVNSKNELNVKGYLTLLSGEKFDFSGKIKEGIYDIEVRPKRGLLKIQGSISKDGFIDANFKVYHILLGGYDLVCDGTFKNEIAYSAGEIKKPVITGWVETKNCVLNYKPFLNLKALYRIVDSNLEISEVSFSDIVKGHGSFLLREPFTTNATFTANNLSLSWLALALVGAKNGPSIVSGTLNGKCDLKGPLANLRSNTQIDVRKGAIATLSFENLSAHFKGDGPLIRIEDSRITRESGCFVLAGDIDLRKIGKGSLFGNIRLVGDDKAINWDGWDTSKLNNIREVRMKKRINDDIDINFKKFTSEDTIDESLKSKDEVQLEYKLHPNDSLKVMVGQDEEFLGIEHKDKF